MRFKTWIVALGLAASTAGHPGTAFGLRPSLGFGAGASLPMRPSAVRDLWNTGFALSGAILFKVTPLVSVGIDAGYYQHGSDSGAFENQVLDALPGVQFDGFNYWFVPVTAVAEVNLVPWGVTKPFLRGGAGYYRTGTTSFSASGFGSGQVTDALLGDFSGSFFGGLIGAGVRTPLVPGTSLSFDVTYHVIATDGGATHFLPVRVRIEF